MGAGCWPERREGGAGGAREKIAGGWALAREMHPSWALPGRRGGRGWALAAGDWAMCAFAVCQRESQRDTEKWLSVVLCYTESIV